jgi:hypothetical protein
MESAPQPLDCGASARTREQALSDFSPVDMLSSREYFDGSNAGYAIRVARGTPGGIRC